jgi:hypothetical protein
MAWKAAHATTLGVMLFGLWPATTAKADDQQLVEDYLQCRGVSGAVVRPVTDDFVGRTFPDFSFFGVIFRQYPLAVQCPATTDLKCMNLFFVRNSQIDFVSTIEELKFFFAVNLGPAPTQDAATDAASTWLRFSEELKQDLFYTFSPRAVFGPHQDVPGGKTGYVVTRERQLGKDGPIVKEHEFDVAVSRELREIDKQIAMELGQWVEKSDQTRRVASIEDLSDDALLQAIERGRRLKAQREQKPN